MFASCARLGVRVTCRYGAVALQSQVASRIAVCSAAKQRNVCTSNVRALHVANVTRTDSEKPSASQQDEEAIQKHVAKLVSSEKVVLFMKGIPSEPRCGFSRAAVMILEAHGVPFAAVNILEDDDLRQAVKKFSGWPTYPQCYVQGKLIGGTDILMELHRSREIVDELRKAGIESTFKYRTEEEQQAEKDNAKK